MSPYTPTYSASQVAGMPADIIGTAGVAVKGYVPLFMMGAVGYGLYRMGRKAVKKAKMAKKVKGFSKVKSYRSARSTKKFGWGFYV